MPGELSIGVFVKLMNSLLNSIRLFSITGKNFWKLRSRVLNPGPRTVPIPQEPKLAGLGAS